MCHNCRTTYRQPAYCAQCGATLSEWVALDQQQPAGPVDDTPAIEALCQAMRWNASAHKTHARLRAAGWELRRA